MISFSVYSKDVALFVSDILGSLNIDSRSITTTNREKSEDCCVSIAIDLSSEDTVASLGQIYFSMLMRI